MSQTGDRALNLQQLSRSRRQKLAWLGILSPDAAIAPRMVTTLWDVEEEEAREILEDFSDRSLLQRQELADGTQGFSLPDTVGDLAREFLVASGESDRDGLGFADLAEAHEVLLTRYRSQTQRGLRYTLLDDGYIYEHLTWHLEQAKWFDKLHELFQKEMQWGNNAWYAAREGMGQEAGFLDDVGRAWRLAEDLFAEDPRRAIALQIRYLLITTSINSLAENIPAGLIAAFVGKGIWTPVQGLRRAERCSGKIKIPRQCGTAPLPDPPALSPRGRAWVALLPYLSESLLLQVLEASSQWEEESQLIERLSRFNGYPFTMPISRVIEEICQIEEEGQRLDRLTSLALEYLPDSLLPPVLEEQQQAELLGALVSYLPTHLLPRVLDAANQLRQPYPRAKAFGLLVPHFPEMFPQALEMARQLDNEYQRAKQLSILAIDRVEILPQALEAIRQLEDEKRRAELLCLLSGHWQTAIAQSPEATRNQAVSESLQSSFRDILFQTLEIICQFKDFFHCLDPHAQFKALRALAAAYPETVPRALELALQASNQIIQEKISLAIAPHIPKTLLNRALEMSSRMKQYSYLQANFLGLLAVNFGDILPQALEALRQLDKEGRVVVLSDLACQYPHLLPEALKVISLQLDSDRISCLSRLACHHPEIIPQTLETIGLLQGSEQKKVEALDELAPHIPLHLLPRALRISHPDLHPYRQAQILTDLACHLPAMLPQALEAVQCDNAYKQADRLIALVSHYPEITPRVSPIARQLPDNYQPRVLSVLAHRDPQILPEALKLARSLELKRNQANSQNTSYYAHEQVKVWRTLARYFPETLPEALEVASRLELFWQSHLLNDLAFHYPKIVPQALEAACQLDDDFQRSQRLSQLAPHLPKHLLPRVLEAFQQMKSIWRAHLLGALACHHPELIPQALEVARQAKPGDRLRGLSDLGSHCPEIVLEAIRQSRDEFSQVKALKNLVPCVPERLLSQTLEIVRKLWNQKKQAEILVLFVKYKHDFSLWCEILHLLDRYRREDLLECFPELIPAIVSLSGTKETLADIARVIQDVQRQWP
ncbi:MAG: hypothetical protein J7647_10495 [Cyanobacteria bacterium SBLK]|nr:hypothetical protein [Cyanobacteria bacterium SBLK]